ncbi:hypothetical protein ACSNN6_30130, partial [Brevibacillus formosus]
MKKQIVVAASMVTMLLSAASPFTSMSTPVYAAEQASPAAEPMKTMNQAAAVTTASYQDEGFAYALSHGYPALPAIKTEQAGYTIQVKDIMVDQLRIAYTVMISGDKIEALAKKPEKERE